MENAAVRLLEQEFRHPVRGVVIDNEKLPDSCAAVAVEKVGKTKAFVLHHPEKTYFRFVFRDRMRVEPYQFTRQHCNLGFVQSDPCAAQAACRDRV